MRLGCLLLAACAAPPTMQIAAIDGDPTYVPTESGLAHGTLEEGMRAFRGLRYAAPPVGDLRWRDPAPPPPCPDGVCEAAEFGPICLQRRFNGTLGGSEDCLSLNVFAPLAGANLPVLVCAHGGGLARGWARAAPPFPPPIVVDQNVVFVTIQYRLNVFGGLAHHLLTLESGGSADYYLLDTIAALEWVQRNIAAF